MNSSLATRWEMVGWQNFDAWLGFKTPPGPNTGQQWLFFYLLTIILQTISLILLLLVGEFPYLWFQSINSQVFHIKLVVLYRCFICWNFVHVSGFPNPNTSFLAPTRASCPVLFRLYRSCSVSRHLPNPHALFLAPASRSRPVLFRLYLSCSVSCHLPNLALFLAPVSHLVLFRIHP